MRVLPHEFAGYAFVMDLARALADRGHEITFAYSPDVPSGKGAVGLLPDDPKNLRVVPLALEGGYERYSPLRRIRDEITYGRRAAAITHETRPDVVLSSNMPLLAQRQILRAARSCDAGFVYWLQDLLGVGIADQLRKRFGILGGAPASWFERLEQRLLAAADVVVPISGEFSDALRRAGVGGGRVHVVENWAPIDEVPPVDKDNPWAREHDLHDRTVFLYSGTLGLKHDPSYIVELGRAFADDDDVAVVLVSEGLGADQVRETSDDVLVLPYQPYADLPAVLGTADVLVALLEPAAGRFSVPSKILTYQCAGRPTLAAMPSDNAAARQLVEEGSGVVVPVGNHAAFIAAARSLATEDGERARMGKAARTYAEKTFAIERITDRFERILEQAHSARPARSA